MDLPCRERLAHDRIATKRNDPRRAMVSRNHKIIGQSWRSDALAGIKNIMTVLAARAGLFCIFALCVIIGVVPASAQSPEPPQDILLKQDEADFVHFGDLIDVNFANGFEYNWRGGITPEGFLDGLDGLGERVYALCRSEKEIADNISKIYGKILRNPKVEVRILDRSNRAVVRLSGAVKFNQRFQIKRSVHLRELLVIAGGVTDEASGEITVFRPGNLGCVRSTSSEKTENALLAPNGNGSQMLNITISALLSGSLAADPLILSGDIISVEKAVPIYVIGAVNNPRQVYSRSEITLTRAIASAGGSAKDAIDDITIFRRENGESRVIGVNLAKVKSGELIDEVLKPFDIIDVPRRGAGKRQYPPVLDPGLLNEPRSANPPLRVID